MARRKRIIPEDLSLLKALVGKGCTTRSLVATTGLDRKLVRKRTAALRKLGLISPKPDAPRTYILTSLGSRLTETEDVHVVEPYSPAERIPLNLGFRFAVGDGLFTGDIALSYSEFADLSGRVDARSLTFHLYRGDFERWVSDVFQDKKTASKLRRLASRPMPPDQLRSRLFQIFSAKRIEETKVQEKELE